MPCFDDLYLDDDGKQISTARIVDHTGSDIGEHRTYQFRFNQGDLHEARVYRLDSQYSSPVNVLMQSDLPYLTLLDGLSDYTTGRRARLTGLDKVVVGSNQGSSESSWLGDVKRVPSTFRESLKSSIARSAFKSQIMVDWIQGENDLPKKLIKDGPSQASIWTPAHYEYAPLVGNEIEYSDTDAPCDIENLFRDPKDFLLFAAWAAVEGISVVALGVKAVRDDAVDRYKRTTNGDLNFAVSNIIGGGPALATGEFGRTVKAVPRDSPLHFTSFNWDLLSKANLLRERFAEHPNVRITTPSRKWLTHNLGITDETNMDEGSMRINAMQHLILEKPNAADRTTDDYNQIYDMEPGMGYSIPNTALASKAS
jgi:hypothetical protein